MAMWLKGKREKNKLNISIIATGINSSIKYYHYPVVLYKNVKSLSMNEKRKQEK